MVVIAIVLFGLLLGTHPDGPQAVLVSILRWVYKHMYGTIRALFSSPMRYADFNFNFLFSQATLAVGLTLFSAILLVTKPKWEKWLLGVLSNKPMRSALVKFFLLPAMEEHLLLGPSIWVGTLLFEFMIPDMTPCPYYGELLMVNVVFLACVMCHHGLQRGLYVPISIPPQPQK